MDKDLPPAEDENDVLLDGLYQYTLHVNGFEQQQILGPIATDTRGMNAPSNVFVTSSHPAEAPPHSSIEVYWTDNSRIEDHFKVFYFRSDSPGDTVKLWGANGNSDCPGGPDDQCNKPLNETYGTFSDRLTVTDLEPDTEYCFLVRAEDHVGWSTSALSDGEYSCGKTFYEPSPPPPPPPSGEETATVWLENERIIKGGAAYQGQYGPIRPDVPYLTKITNTSGRGIKFVKAGRTTDECGIESAVVPLIPGEETTPSMLDEIWGTPMPVLGPTDPLIFTACAEGEVVDRIFVKISYRYMNSDAPPDTIPDR